MQNQMGFSQREYDRRIRRTKQMVDHRETAILLAVDPAAVNYLSGYDGSSFCVHQGVIMALD